MDEFQCVLDLATSYGWTGSCAARSLSIYIELALQKHIDNVAEAARE